MSGRITARELFDALGERLQLRWRAGLAGAGRMLDRDEHGDRRPSLAGYLNIIYPNKVQILGGEELAWLDALDDSQRRAMLTKILAFEPLALVVSRDREIPADLLAAAEEAGIALWSSPRTGHELINRIQYRLSEVLATRITLHGVFMEIYSIGVLITGDSGTGKSELALELITRGHRLIADDAAEFTQITPDILDGTCPDMLRDLLEVRGLGVLNVREMFGDTAIKYNKYLRLIVHLKRWQGEVEEEAPMARLLGDVGHRPVLDLDVPTITLPVAPGRNLAVLVEAATRLHILRAKGIDPANAFIARHTQHLTPGTRR